MRVRAWVLLWAGGVADFLDLRNHNKKMFSKLNLRTIWETNACNLFNLAIISSYNKSLSNLRFLYRIFQIVYPLRMSAIGQGTVCGVLPWKFVYTLECFVQGLHCQLTISQPFIDIQTRQGGNSERKFSIWLPLAYKRTKILS